MHLKRGKPTTRRITGNRHTTFSNSLIGLTIGHWDSTDVLEDGSDTYRMWIDKSSFRFNVVKEQEFRAKTFPWFWLVRLMVKMPNQDVNEIEVKLLSHPLKLMQFDEALMEYKNRILEENPNYIDFGWEAEIIGSPI